MTAKVVGISFAGLLLVLLMAWVTWTFVFDDIDRVMVMMFLDTFTGAGSLGGQ